MAAIVLVHGIAQEQYSADLLESKWLPALAGGVRTAGFPDIADKIWRAGPGAIEARMAFYGHLFLRPGAQGLGAEELSPEQAELAEQLSLEWLETGQDAGLERRAASDGGDRAGLSPTRPRSRGAGCPLGGSGRLEEPGPAPLVRPAGQCGRRAVRGARAVAGDPLPDRRRDPR